MNRIKKYTNLFYFNNVIFKLARAILLLRNKSYRDLFFEINKDDVCLDLGANVGDASLIMWLKGAKYIYAIEPNYDVFNLLKKNLKGIKNVSFFNIAISSKKGTQKLFLHQLIKDKFDKHKIIKLSQASSLLEDKSNLGDCFYEVKTLTFKDLFNKLKIKPTFIKCDIEGGEYIIYDQLIDIAKSKTIRKIFVECHAKKYPQYREVNIEFIDLINKNNLNNIFDTKWQ